jgi:asparagine synthase (glutamine-hydrolysing)
MCGLSGYVGRVADGPGILQRMTAAIGHRGPDSRGILAVDGAGLVHARLAIVGLSDGAQPMRDASDALAIAFNGEIFNYVELRDDLKAKGRNFRTSSDTEVILHLYDEMGEDCLPLFNGDFAFAIWDGRKRRMLIARDRMGVRPLFYARCAGTWFFASEIKALLAAPGISAEIDPVALDQVFTTWAPIAPSTLFAGVRELEPGHLAVIDETGLTTRPWWSLEFPDARDRPPTDSASAVDELEALLTDAVRIRMRADVPVGAYLSGGLDSSLATALAAPMAASGLETFSVTFDSAEHDESAFQAKMVAAIGGRHHAMRCRDDDIAGAFAEVIRHAEQPLLRTAPAPLYLLSRLVQQTGLKVVLTGEGADEVFAGYDIFKEAKLRRFVARQPNSRVRVELFRRLYPYLPGLKAQSGRSLAAFFGAGDVGLGDPLYSHRPRFRATAGARLFFSADLKARLGAHDAAEDIAARLPARFSRWHPLHQAQYLEIRFLLPGYILSAQGDRMAMAHGVEGRFPFLDPRLVAFAAGLSPETKLKGLTEKYILRQVARRHIPLEIADRAKQPYRAPDSAAFAGRIGRALVGAALSPAVLADTGLFDPAMVSRLVAKWTKGGLASFRDNAAFIGVLSTQLWRAAFSGAGATENRAA